MVVRVTNEPVIWAALPAAISILVDLDSTLSPSSGHQHIFHSPALLLIALSFGSFLALLGAPIALSTAACIALSTHLLQDILHGEPVHLGPLSDRIDLSPWHRPDIGRYLDMASLPLVLVMMLL